MDKTLIVRCKKMKIQRQIPVFFRVPLALLSYAGIGFGPVVLALYLRPPSWHVAVVLVPGILWLIVFDRCFLWRLDCFWNVKSMQNRTPHPERPDNHRTFKTFKGWCAWVFLGKDTERKDSPNQQIHGTAYRRP